MDLGKALLLLSLSFGWLSCGSDVSWIPELPLHIDTLPRYGYEDLTNDQIDLGRQLFFDPILSRDSTIACGSCHLPSLAFTDGQPVSPGIEGRLGKRNTPTILNAGFLKRINHDGGVASLNLQPLVPIEDEHEMDIPIVQLIKRLRNHADYQAQSQTAYGDSLNAFVLTRALAAFVRSQLSVESPYDKFLEGEVDALSQEAETGLKLFNSERLGCRRCHSGALFTNQTFANNGLVINPNDLGRALITLDSVDRGKFRVPSLRNVALTPPYMHDGSISSLIEVIEHYEFVGHHPQPGQSTLLQAFKLDEDERVALLTFLQSLTDISQVNIDEGVARSHNPVK